MQTIKQVAEGLGWGFEEPLMSRPAKRYQCEVCGDLGRVTANVPFGHPYFGKAFDCPAKCAAWEALQQEKMANIQKWTTVNAKDYGDFTFDSFLAYSEEARAGKMHALGAANLWAEGQPFTLQQAARYVGNMVWSSEQDKYSNWLVLYGAPGYGKTAMAASAANAVRRALRPVYMARVLDYMQIAMDSFKNDYAMQELGMLRLVFKNITWLVLDEATMAPSEFKMDEVDQILRHRDLAGLPTLITTNYDRDEFYTRWGYRVGDICHKAHWVQMGGAVKLRQTQADVNQENF